MDEEVRLVVGLGNPGKAYESTRHNIGFRVVRAFAEAKGMVFRSMYKEMGELAKGPFSGKTVALLLPTTYMNNSGTAVKFCTENFKVPMQHLLVVSDDIYLPFGAMRLREKGTAGGHKGLQSIIEAVGEEFPRLKMGVGLQESSQDLADYVLGRFTPEEEAEIPTMIKKALEILDNWISKGIMTIPVANGPKGRKETNGETK
jgi:PTH1 family peptidyl-tRNA hydrolase